MCSSDLVSSWTSGSWAPGEDARKSSSISVVVDPVDGEPRSEGAGAIVSAQGNIDN